MNLFQWLEGDFIITDNAALSHRAGDDSTLRSNEIGLRIIHRSQTKARKPLRHALGYVKRVDRREQYLKHKRELERENHVVEDSSWCPLEDDELCGDQGQLIKQLRAATGRDEL